MSVDVSPSSGPGPRRDAQPVIPQPTIWVLAQVAPRFEVLATSGSRDKLSAELDDLVQMHRERGERTFHRWYIRQAPCHLG